MWKTPFLESYAKYGEEPRPMSSSKFKEIREACNDMSLGTFEVQKMSIAETSLGHYIEEVLLKLHTLHTLVVKITGKVYIYSVCAEESHSKSERR